MHLSWGVRILPRIPFSAQPVELITRHLQYSHRRAHEHKEELGVFSGVKSLKPRKFTLTCSRHENPRTRHAPSTLTQRDKNDTHFPRVRHVQLTCTHTFHDGSVSIGRKNFILLCPLRRGHIVIAPSYRSFAHSHFRVRAVTLSYMDGFLNYFTQILSISRRCVACKTRVICSKVKVTRGHTSLTSDSSYLFILFCCFGYK